MTEGPQEPAPSKPSFGFLRRVGGLLKRGRSADARGLTASRDQRIVHLIASDSPIGTLLCILLAFVLTASTYYLFNHVLLRKPIDDLATWSTFGLEELSSAFVAATGKRPVDSAVEQQPPAVQMGAAARAIRQRLGLTVSCDGTTLEKLAESPALPRPANRLEFRWSLDPSVAFSLVIERLTDTPLRILAHYRVLLKVGTGLDNRLVPQRTLVPSDFVVVEEQAIPVCPGLQPIAVNHSAEGLAGRFFPLARENVRGLTAEDGGLLSGKDYTFPKGDQESESTLFIGDLIARRIGKVRDRGSVPPTGEGFVTPAESREIEELDVSRSEFLEPSEMLSNRRRLNGSDAWGCIQYFTFFVFYYLMSLLAFKLLDCQGQAKYLVRDSLFRELSEEDRDRDLSKRVELCQTLRSNYGSDRFDDRDCVPLEVLYAGCSGITRGGYENVPDFVHSRGQHLLEKLGTSFAIVRFLAWAMPSVGFVGTVLGIGNALLGTSGVLSADPFAQQSSIQSMAQTLGTAFDTTFVALILSIPAMACIHIVQRMYEGLVHSSVDRTLAALVDPKYQFSEETAPEPQRPAHAGAAVPIDSARKSPRMMLPKQEISVVYARVSMLREVVLVGFLATALASVTLALVGAIP